MNERSIYILAALAGGGILPIQVALNTLLRRSLVAEPMPVTFISFLAGTLASVVICGVARYPLPNMAAIGQTSWWMWIGGCLGALYVWSTIFTTPRIGAALALGLAIAGQMTVALWLDHLGAIGLTRYPASPMRIAGVMLIIAGVWLIADAKR
jgi:bacterial/archaeal transporter family-2 protein